MKKRIALFAILGFSFLFSCKNAPDIYESLAYKFRNSIWTRFRENFQYTIQAIGSQAMSDGSYIIIASEPPPDVTPDEITKFMADYNGKYELKNHPIGYDGWVKDVVFTINGVDSEQEHEFIVGLNKLLYKTVYKPYTIDLSKEESPNAFSARSLNLQVSAEELNSWLIDQHETFKSQSSENGQLEVSNMLDQNLNGVFYSSKPGLIIWSFNRNADVDTLTKDIRHFAVDCDLIIGALASESQLCIIGRERESEVIDLAPLRTETIKLLASANDEQIAQSYERNTVFAGKMSGGKDWAPIYLSDELWHTEYGQLLNITDQMLKSWSQNGKVDYERFYYPKPFYWAFNKSASEDLKASVLTFNWNTKGAVYSIKKNNIDVVALNRTGSLPVTYIPEGVKNENQSILNAEKKAYDYFSNLSNHYLVRANEYAALYQIFSNYGSKIKRNGLGNTRANLENPLIEKAANALKYIENSSVEIMQKRYVEFIKQQYSGLPISKTKNFDQELYLLSVEKKEDFEEQILSLKKLKTELGESIFEKIARVVVEPRKIPNLNTLSDSICFIYGREMASSEDIKTVIEVFSPDQKSSILSQYTTNYLIDTNFWLKTPSVVCSWDVDSTAVTGGHNIESRIVPIRVSNELRPGEFKVVDEGLQKIVYVSERDSKNITSDFLRHAEKTENAGVQSYRFASQDLPIRPRGQVIKTDARNIRGFNFTQEGVSGRVVIKGNEIVTVDGSVVLAKIELKNVEKSVTQLNKMQILHCYDEFKIRKGISPKFSKLEKNGDGYLLTFSAPNLEPISFQLPNIRTTKIYKYKIVFLQNNRVLV